MRVRPLPVLLLAVSASAQQWTALDGPRFLDRFSAFDVHRGRLVTFSGDSATFEYDGVQVLSRPVLTGSPVPLARYRAGLVYDEQRRHVLMFGGRSPIFQGPNFGDTWTYDGMAWRQLTAGPQPAARSDANMVFDAAQGRVLMLGGGGVNDGLWQHDGSQWSNLGTAPPGHSCMVHDRGRGVTVLVAGSATLGVASTTWEWNGVSWLQRVTAQGPFVNGNSSIAYDPLRQRVVLFGGAANGEGLWEWNGNAWSMVLTVTQPRRTDPAMWFDPALGKIVIAGGTDVAVVNGTVMSGSARTDFWTWDGSALTLLRPDHRPPARHEAMLFADLFRERLVLFGGGAVTPANDTWLWDGNAWTRSPTVNLPSPRSGAAVTFDWTRGLGLLFGGFAGQSLGDLWSWNGTDWSLLNSGLGPQARWGAALSYDITRDVAVMFGGFAGSPGSMRNDTWEWTGSAWLLRTTPVAPSPRFGAAMTFDLARNRTVLYGGSVGSTVADNLGDLWEWNGSAWQQVTLPNGPPALGGPSLSYELARQRCVLTGATTASNRNTFFVWEYDGATWTQLSSQASSPVFGPCAMMQTSSRITCVPFAALFEFSATGAEVGVVGAGCGAPELTLSPRTRPRVGAPEFGFECMTTPGLAAVFGYSGTTAPQPLGNGCTVWLGQPVVGVFTVAAANGRASTPLPVPRAYGLRGLQVYAQFAALDATSPGGLRLSQALRIRVGD